MGKKAEFTFQQIIALVLVAVLVVGVIIFITRAQITNYIKILPGYQMPENNNDVNTDVSSDQIGNAEQFSCSGEFMEVGSINTDIIYIGGQKTNLIFKGSEIQGKIIYDGKWKITRFWSNGNIDVAKVENGQIFSLDFKEGKIDDEITEQLKKIDGSKYLAGKLCKKVSE